MGVQMRVGSRDYLPELMQLGSYLVCLSSTYVVLIGSQYC